MILAVSGIRDLHEGSVPDVELTIAEEAGRGFDEVRFGGASGTDTVALEACCFLRRAESPKLVVYVPFTVEDQPDEAREVAEVCADEIVELDLPDERRSYLRRNDAMLDGADKLLAFTDGRAKGGTWYSINQALNAGIAVEIVEVVSSGKRQRNPLVLPKEEFPGPTHALWPYLRRPSKRRRRRDAVDPRWATEVILLNKDGEAARKDIVKIARHLVDYISEVPALSRAEAVVAMPRRDPDAQSDLQLMAEEVARLRGMDTPDDLLVRERWPVGGQLMGDRVWFSPERHAASMAVHDPERYGEVIVLDNVITTGSTMVAAQTVLLDAGVRPHGLSVLYSRFW